MSKESCPACGARPCDWAQDPNAYRDFLIMVLVDIRAALGVGEKPMMSELPALIRERLTTTTQAQGGEGE